ncbi:hypothetical protein F4778DRAFT_728256 [Xylariomycetidae sp. FL2044]|nr:hypothetical protein F4778DRAFT_728256 [Xylariomycetidae sp. FL2044]
MLLQFFPSLSALSLICSHNPSARALLWQPTNQKKSKKEKKLKRNPAPIGPINMINIPNHHHERPLSPETRTIRKPETLGLRFIEPEKEKKKPSQYVRTYACLRTQR